MTNLDALDVTGSINITATGSVTLNDTVTAPGGFSSEGTTFGNTGATITTTDNNITIDHTGVVTIGAALTTTGGKVSLTAAAALTSTANGTITTTGVAGDPGTAGGEVLLHSTGAGAITFSGGITASGGAGAADGNSGGNGGVVTVLNADGAITVDDITTLGGAGNGAGKAGFKGTVQLSATTTITQQVDTKIMAGNLKLKSTGGNVTLNNNAGNELDILAAAIGGGHSLSYIDADNLTIGTVPAAGNDAASLGEMAGIMAYGGNSGSITVKTSNGTLTVDHAVQAVDFGTILLEALGQGRDIVVNAAVKSDAGEVK